MPGALHRILDVVSALQGFLGVVARLERKPLGVVGLIAGLVGLIERFLDVIAGIVQEVQDRLGLVVRIVGVVLGILGVVVRLCPHVFDLLVQTVRQVAEPSDLLMEGVDFAHGVLGLGFHVVDGLGVAVGLIHVSLCLVSVVVGIVAVLVGHPVMAMRCFLMPVSDMFVVVNRLNRSVGRLGVPVRCLVMRLSGRSSVSGVSVGLPGLRLLRMVMRFGWVIARGLGLTGVRTGVLHGISFRSEDLAPFRRQLRSAAHFAAVRGRLAATRSSARHAGD